ncbi:RICIN domain-containing protein [Streptomyces sp. NPDC127074]|uniref:RICIN domain-containing protein n=1 Tax=Streptomyces sp. NPDC127074 TaxID=3347130 RepID=UPI0036676C12
MVNGGNQDPRSARNAAEFVALLRELKERSGLTYRHLEERATERGDVLARSTLSDALRQDVLPRTETLMAFLRACGEEDRAGEWLEARNDIAAGRPPLGIHGKNVEPESGTSTESETLFAPEGEQREPSRDRRSVPRGRLIGAALAVLLLGAATLVVAMAADDGAPKTRDTAAPSVRSALSTPPPGTYRIRSVVSSLCLSELESKSGGNIFQTECRRSVPVYALEESEDATVRLRSLHPVFGYGCLGVGQGSPKGGTQMMDDYCGHRGTAESFRVQRVTKPVRGYRIKPVHSGQCVSVPGGSPRKGDPVLQLPCAADDTGQIFRFDPVRAPTAIPSITSN